MPPKTNSNFQFILLEEFSKIEIGYSLDVDTLDTIQSWTSEQEDKERTKIFELFVWFPVSHFDCEYCGNKEEIKGYNLQYGFSFHPDDYDRIRILCNDCSED